MERVKIQTNRGEPIELSEESLHGLERELKGDFLLPDDPDYEEARRVWNGMIDRHPAIDVRCADADDVARAVDYARRHDLRLCVRGGGHNVAGKAVDDDAMVIDLSRMRAVDVDPDTRRVRVEAGARLGDVDRATEPYGLAVPLGVISRTGVAGLTLHGGAGWLSRKFGLSIDNLRAVEIVTADGRTLRASAVEHPDLFWAVRGGGGNFGVVTSFEFQARPIGPEIRLVAPVFPAEQRLDVLEAFGRFMESAPPEVGGISVLWSAPDLPVIPEELRGSKVVIPICAYQGPADGAERIASQVLELGEPIADLGGPMAWTDLQSFLDDDYPDGRLYYWKSIYLDRDDREVHERLVDHHDRAPSPLSSLDVWHLGEAVSGVGVTETAFAQRDAPYLLGIEANWEDPAESEANIAWAREVFRDMGRFSRGGTYLNFPGFAEESTLLDSAYGENLPRLRQVKAMYDPENLFRGNFNIEPAEG